MATRQVFNHSDSRFQFWLHIKRPVIVILLQEYVQKYEQYTSMNAVICCVFLLRLSYRVYVCACVLRKVFTVSLKLLKRL